MGSGAALAAYRRERHARTLAECAEVCGAASRFALGRPVGSGEDRARRVQASAAARDCQDLCSLAVSLMARESDQARYAFPACAEACRRCAAACDPFPAEEILARCSRLCRQAEEICRDRADPVLS